MTYYKLFFLLLFLPSALLIYQLIPKKFRWTSLLGFSLLFYIHYNQYLIIYALFTTGVSYCAGLLLEKLQAKASAAVKAAEKDQKKSLRAAFKKKQKLILIPAILLVLGVLLYLKYFNFFAENVNRVLSHTGTLFRIGLSGLVIPVGISFYTLQAVGYMADVYWGKVKAEKNPLKLLLFLIFFPTLIEGPIAAYTDIHEKLFSGEPVKAENVMNGYVRILWGILKKLVIADRLHVVVGTLFDNYTEYSGIYIVLAMVAFTIREYMEFSGCIDMAIGCGELFGIKLPENFRQPFFAKNASEFWRRWHITLGVWFKTYIFYPVSMSEAAKKWNKNAPAKFGKTVTRLGASALALFPVWISNGLWHGPKWTYIFYGIYYFVMIIIELALDPPFEALLTKAGLKKESRAVTVIRVLRTWAVIFIGELFFRADSMKIAWSMFLSMFGGAGIRDLVNGGLLSLGMDKADWIIVMLGLIITITVSIIKEKGTEIRVLLAAKPAVIRDALYLMLFLFVIFLGQFGPGFMEVDLIYAGF